MTKEIESRVRSVMHEMFDADMRILNPDAILRDDLGADGLDIIELAMTLECEFEIELPHDEWEKVVTVRDVIELVKRKVAH